MDSPRARGKIIGLLVVAVLVTVFGAINVRRRVAEQQLLSSAMELEKLQGNEEQSKEVARQIVDKLRAHYALSADANPTVAAIVDVELLRKKNAFYNRAENGDFLIIVDGRAILYDLDDDRILDMIPVQITAKEEAESQ